MGIFHYLHKYDLTTWYYVFYKSIQVCICKIQVGGRLANLYLEENLKNAFFVPGIISNLKCRNKYGIFFKICQGGLAHEKIHR